MQLALVMYISNLAMLNYVLARTILIVEDGEGVSNLARRISSYDLDILPGLSLLANSPQSKKF